MEERIAKLEKEVEELKRIIEQYQDSWELLEQAIANNPKHYGV